MRLYRFMSAENGLRSIRDRRLRIGRIEELNDDFEFVGIALKLKEERVAFRQMRKHLNEANGILCMSEAWESPLMWAHYGDSHKGMALGFDVPDEAFYKVDYVKERPTLASMGLNNLDEITAEDIKRLTRMKASGWDYEKEYRSYQRLKDGVPINGQTHYFISMNPNLRLREVIVGSRFKTARQEVLDAVNDPSVDVFMARGDFDQFKVVRQNQDSMWP
ncbi:DUF2971 domain-containing protein [Rhizobium leguminosarum]|uniref:DUF2971 domain-containing protein n=1 Tax=Rhizobium leguminosarum TaxID=384 RepID=UPI001C90960B|nr:DUF2971 domain-containing protein [Rhizobium leguminosarum]MBY2984863.1 DUF2971 domain-containing protein [Rhizobium leguminosarum]